MGRGWNRPGLWFGVFVIALGAVVLADVVVVEAGRSSVSRFAEPQVQDDRVVRIREIHAEPGDVIRVYTGVGGVPFERYEFYAVEYGEGQAYAQGGRATHVYAQASGPANASAHDSTVLYIVRPDAPMVQEGEWLDLVWVIHYAEGVTRPGSPGARDYFERWVKASSTTPTPEVTASESVTFHKFAAVPLTVLLALGVVATGVWWLRTLVAGRESFDADERAASGVALVDMGGNYLGFLLALVLGLGLPLLYVAWVSLVYFSNQVVETPGPSAGWGSIVMAGVYVALAAVVAGWAAMAWRVTRSHRRWRQIMAQRPIDL